MEDQEKINKDKLLRCVSVLVKANSLKNDPKQFSTFIKKNKSYFPFIDQNQIEKLIDKNQEPIVPIFQEYKLNENIKK